MDHTERGGKSAGGHERCGTKRGGSQRLPVEMWACKAPSWGRNKWERRVGACVKNRPKLHLLRGGRGRMCVFVCMWKMLVAPPARGGRGGMRVCGCGGVPRDLLGTPVDKKRTRAKRSTTY